MPYLETGVLTCYPSRHLIFYESEMPYLETGVLTQEGGRQTMVVCVGDALPGDGCVDTSP